MYYNVIQYNHKEDTYMIKTNTISIRLDEEAYDKLTDLIKIFSDDGLELTQSDILRFAINHLYNEKKLNK